MECFRPKATFLRLERHFRAEILLFFAVVLLFIIINASLKQVKKYNSYFEYCSFSPELLKKSLKILN